MSPVRPGFASVGRCLPFDAASFVSRVSSNSRRCPFLIWCKQPRAVISRSSILGDREWFCRLLSGMASGLGPMLCRPVIGVAGCVQPSSLALLVSHSAVTAFCRPNGSRAVQIFCGMLSATIIRLRPESSRLAPAVSGRVQLLTPFYVAPPAGHVLSVLRDRSLSMRLQPAAAQPSLATSTNVHVLRT